MRLLLYLLPLIVIMALAAWWYVASLPQALGVAPSEYTTDNFKLAQEEGKLVLLYFYTDWCPGCYVELMQLKKALKKFDPEELAVYVVDYKGEGVIAEEEELARDLKVDAKQTKVLIYHGKEVMRSADPWDEKRYTFELDTILKE
jgi:peroxiredoxin